MDDIVTDVNEGYSEDPDLSINASMQYVFVVVAIILTHTETATGSRAATITFVRSSKSTSMPPCRLLSTRRSCLRGKEAAL